MGNIDQCNMNKLDLPMLISNSDHHKQNYNTSITIFTSDHYAPGENWVQLTHSGCLKYKVIDIQCQEDAVEQIKQQLKDTDDRGITSSDLLDITKIYGFMYECIVGIREDPYVNVDQLRQKVYRQRCLHRVSCP